MTEVNSLFVLDVGHGSCAAIVQGASAVLIDVGPGAALLQFLQEKGIQRIESVVISHADADHLGGLVGLLASQEVSIGNVYINSDGVKGSELWKDVAYELDDLERSGEVINTIGLSEGKTVECSLDGWGLEILAPRHRLLQLGVGNTDRAGRLITTNAMSIVARVLYDSAPVALCPGDLDHVGYSHMVDHPAEFAPNLEAQVLLLPHHGGYSGTTAETEEVVAGLVTAVKPARVISSHGRRKHHNPLRVVVDSVRTAGPNGVRLVCTQMSSNCLAGSADLGLPQVSPHASAGAEAGISCAGTAEISVDGGMPTDEAHQAMIEAHAPGRLCNW